MLLVVDVGNTNITMGIMDGQNILGTFRMTTKENRTSDEYGVLVYDMIRRKGFDPKEIENTIIASVVPKMMYSFTSAIYKYFGKNPIIVGPGIKTGISIKTSNPKQLGADRIVDAVAAYEIYGGPVLVIDYGTATTYDLVNEKGEFLAGLIVPGIQTSANVLWQAAAKLPEIEIKKPKTILAKDTVSSMQAGVYFSCIGETSYIVKRFKKETGMKDLKVVATGGLGKIVSHEKGLIDIYDQNLTLKGLQILYEKQK
ncbi:MAG: type III pantothenate kinase [Lachnospiraceae bacterium]|nr:type III pantothenate kinase [Lachnospiraceae bacterium]